jgi:hypothetical protein
VSEIQRLRDEGHTIAAIHRALIAAGVDVGLSSVQRETARLEQVTRKPSPPPKRVETPTPKAAASVDSFFTEKAANPLFNRRKKS